MLIWHITRVSLCTHARLIVKHFTPTLLLSLFTDARTERHWWSSAKWLVEIKCSEVWTLCQTNKTWNLFIKMTSPSSIKRTWLITLTSFLNVSHYCTFGNIKSMSTKAFHRWLDSSIRKSMELDSEKSKVSTGSWIFWISFKEILHEMEYIKKKRKKKLAVYDKLLNYFYRTRFTYLRLLASQL